MNRICALFGILSVAFCVANALTCDLYTTSAAIQDVSVSSNEGGHVLYLFDSSMTGGVAQFDWSPSVSGMLDINGTSATLTGRIVPLGSASPADGFDLVITFMSADMDSSMAMMGKDELNAGVQVDTSSWMYYTVSTPSYITGFGSFAGISLQLEQQMADMPLQIGIGANGKNLEFGAAVWLNVMSGSLKVAADINLTLNCSSSSVPATPPVCPGGADMIASAATSDSYTVEPAGMSFSFFTPSAALDFVSLWLFTDNAGVLRISNDSVHLSGTIVPMNSSASSLSFTVNLLFQAATSDQLMSVMPHMELSSSAYSENGGAVDVSSWTYYVIDSASSTITNDEGTTIVLSTQMGMPLQIGIGANGKNVQLGASGWFDWTATSSASGTTSGAMDINIDLTCAPASIPAAPVSPASPALPAGCSATVSYSVRTSWPDNNRNVSLIDVTLTNTGTMSISDVTLSIDQHGQTCSFNGQSGCISQIWSVSTALCGVDVSQCALHLPSWLTEYNGLPSSSQLTFGFITYATQTDVAVVPQC